MNKAVSVVGAVGAGAALMYLLDPNSGRRRRAYLRDKAVRIKNAELESLNAAARDLRNRATGAAAKVGSRLRSDRPSNRKLEERIRSKMGRVVSHAGSIHVDCDRGSVTLSGDVLASEVQDLLDRVRTVRGVRHVENRLNVHDSGENIPGLQGEGRIQQGPPDALTRSWMPGTALVMGVLGAAAAAYGISRRDTLGAVLGGVGITVAAKSFDDTVVERMTGRFGKL